MIHNRKTRFPIYDKGDIPVRCVQSGGVCKMNIKSKYSIKAVSNSYALQMVEKYHYLHAKCPCSKAFGLFERNTDRCVGIITYGVPHSPTLRCGICGQTEASNVYELNRVWVDPSVPTGGEAYLITNTICQVDREIIVSYVDTSRKDGVAPLVTAGFYYTGETSRHLDPVVAGHTGHHASLLQGVSKQDFIDFYGKSNVTFVERSRKHRFVSFNARTSSLKALKDKMNYPIVSLPAAI